MSEAQPAPALAPDVAARPRLKRLTIHRYRNVRPGTTIEFDDTWNLLVGKNGTGKTTLLKLLEVVLTGEYERVGRHACHVAYDLALGDADVSVEIRWNCTARVGTAQAGSPVTRGREIDLEATGSARSGTRPTVTWTWRSAEQRSSLTVDGRDTAPPIHSAWARWAAPFPDAVCRSTKAAGWDDVHAFLMFPTQPQRFDEALAYFDALTSWTITSERVPGVSTYTTTPDGVGIAVSVHLSDLVEDALRASGDSDPGWSADVDAALAEFASCAQLGEIRFELPVRRIEVTEEGDVRELGPPRLRFTRPDGTLFFHEDLSFGQKRLLALLYYLHADRPIVLADELSNGLHRDWIDLAVKKLATRQSILAAQNPLVIDAIGFRDAEELRRSLIFCREENGQFVWENAPLDDMKDVYGAYDVGIERISDLLYRKGLW